MASVGPESGHATTKDAKLPGEQVPVLTALDNAGGVYEAILPSLAAIEAVPPRQAEAMAAGIAAAIAAS